MQNSILIWPSSLVSIPTGWLICDGTNGTPDLRNRFIVGAGNNFSVGDTGGSKNLTIIPQHTHTAVTNTAGGHTHLWRGTGGIGTTATGINRQTSNNYVVNNRVSSTAGNHTHTITLTSTGEADGTDRNLPPYLALVYIMKT